MVTFHKTTIQYHNQKIDLVQSSNLIQIFLYLSSFECEYVFIRLWVHTKLLHSCLTLCNPMDCSPQAPLSMGFFRQEIWSGLPCPSPRDLPDPGIEPICLISPAWTGRFFSTSATWEAPVSGFVQFYYHSRFLYLPPQSRY